MIHDEIEAVRHAMSRANRGDLLVVCVDQHPLVMVGAGELVAAWRRPARRRAATTPPWPTRTTRLPES